MVEKFTDRKMDVRWSERKSRLTVKGIKEVICTNCSSTLEYEETDVYSTRDYLGDSNNDKCLECPVCNKGFVLK